MIWQHWPINPYMAKDDEVDLLQSACILQVTSFSRTPLFPYVDLLYTFMLFV